MNENCWDCKYNKLGGMTFFGFCTKFEDSGQKSKEIPSWIMDAGCKCFERKNAIAVQNTINGERLDEKAT